MATRTDNPVTLTHEQAERVSRLLGDYATSQRALAHRTRSDAVRGQCNLTASEAQQLGRRIIEALYTWTTDTDRQIRLDRARRDMLAVSCDHCGATYQNADDLCAKCGAVTPASESL